MQTKHQLEHIPGQGGAGIPGHGRLSVSVGGRRRELRLKLSAGSGWCHSAPLPVQLPPHSHSHFQLKNSGVPGPGREVPPSGAAVTQLRSLSLWERHLSWRMLWRGSGLPSCPNQLQGSPLCSHSCFLRGEKDPNIPTTGKIHNHP